jgi:hypothetical protein
MRPAVHSGLVPKKSKVIAGILLLIRIGNGFRRGLGEAALDLDSDGTEADFFDAGSVAGGVGPS